jgi:hypothetical protein
VRAVRPLNERSGVGSDSTLGRVAPPSPSCRPYAIAPLCGSNSEPAYRRQREEERARMLEHGFAVTAEPEPASEPGPLTPR